jgi:electron transport complex protein RnfC
MIEHFLFQGGVHPDDGKAMSCDAAIQTAPLLEKYLVPLQQHIGAPPKLLVKANDTVLKGQKIAEAGGFVSAPIHSPTSGKVTKLVDCLGPMGTKIPAVEITSDGEDTPDTSLEPIADWQNAEPEVLKKRIGEAGIVGMGGAAFPTSVKLSPPPNKPIDVLILNGVECEPCLTADHRLMLEEPAKIIAGAEIVARVLGAKEIYIGIEANKPDAIALMSEKVRGTQIKVVKLRVRYPQGAEKQLIYAVTRRKVPAGGLPMDVGCVVQNVGTAAAIAEAVQEGKPLYERITTVTGTPVVKPGNWRFRVGTPVRKALELAGGVKSDPGKLILGGPMMGFSIYSLDIPLMKNASGVLLLAPEQVLQYTSEACIRCGRCVDACPMNLLPGTLSVQIESERYDLAESTNVMDCIECGCCSYVCPSRRPLVQHFKRAKSEIAAQRRAASRK